MRQSTGRRYAVKVGVVFLLGGAIFTLLFSREAGLRATAIDNLAKQDLIDNLRHTTGVGAVPVVAAFVESRTVPIYRTGLGTIQPFNSVTLTSRVDGQLMDMPFAEGQYVKKGDVLAQIDPRPYEAQLRQMQAQLRSIQAKLVAARADFDRAAELQKTQAGTRQQYDTRRAEVQQLEASADSTQADIDKAELQVEYCTIRSPIDGRVGLRQVDVGNMILAVDRKAIVTVTQLQPISVVFSLPQEDLVAVAREMAGKRKLAVTVRGRDDREELDVGTLTTIDNQIDQKTGTFKLKAVFGNARNQLWPGQFVTVRLLLEERPKGIVVPAPVLQRGPEGPFAFVITADETVEIRPVTVGPVENGVALVESGLTVGERVVVDGQYKLRPGSRITVVQAVRPGYVQDQVHTVPAGPTLRP